MRLRLKLLPMVILLMLLPVNAFASIARHRHYSVPLWFRHDATCVHMNEEHWSWRWSFNFHPHYAVWNGYYTGMQFDPNTWDRANSFLGRHDDPATASRLNVMLHALAIVRHDKGSWKEWSTSAEACGLPIY